MIAANSIHIFIFFRNNIKLVNIAPAMFLSNCIFSSFRFDVQFSGRLHKCLSSNKSIISSTYLSPLFLDFKSILINSINNSMIIIISSNIIINIKILRYLWSHLCAKEMYKRKLMEWFNWSCVCAGLTLSPALR